MIAEVTALLAQLGYTVVEDDMSLLEFLIRKLCSDITSALGTAEIPEKMHEDYVLAVCGEFLIFKNGTGQLDIGSLNMSGIKTVKEGDTTIEFGGSGSTNTSFGELISYLTKWKEEVPRFRKLVW